VLAELDRAVLSPASLTVETLTILGIAIKRSRKTPASKHLFLCDLFGLCEMISSFSGQGASYPSGPDLSMAHLRIAAIADRGSSNSLKPERPSGKDEQNGLLGDFARCTRRVTLHAINHALAARGRERSSHRSASETCAS
jgi:hypothetical protein